jgi:hypothetical protein
VALADLVRGKINDRTSAKTVFPAVNITRRQQMYRIGRNSIREAGIIKVC